MDGRPSKAGLWPWAGRTICCYRPTGRKAKLTDVIHAAINPFDSGVIRRFVVEDTPIEVGAGAVSPITMSLNELCTNAVKYGALSNSDGRIRIAAAVRDDISQFELTWTETNGRRFRSLARRSFGTGRSTGSPISFTARLNCETSRPATLPSTRPGQRLKGPTAPASENIAVAASR